MDREIDLLIAAAYDGCLLVDKASHVTWSPEDLADAARSGSFEEDDCPIVATEADAYDDPFPACMQLGARPAGHAYVAVGETNHFVLYAPAGTTMNHAVCVSHSEECDERL